MVKCTTAFYYLKPIILSIALVFVIALSLALATDNQIRDYNQQYHSELVQLSEKMGKLELDVADIKAQLKELK